MNIDQYSPQSGRFLKEDGSYVNIADVLGGTETGKTADIEKYAPHTGRFIKEDGTVINIAESIGSGGGSDSGSSDDSAPPIIETYNGQVIQSFISADRPLQGLNLYATCKQQKYSGKNLFNKDTIEDGVVNASGQLDSSEFVKTSDFIKVKPSTQYKSSFNSARVKFYTSEKEPVQTESVDITANTRSFTTGESTEYIRYSFNFSAQTPETLIIVEGTNELTPYEPYTGGIPSPNSDYPQEIETISDFVVEVKNSMGTGATPQTLNVTIPDQGFYGIPVGSTIKGNYTDADGQRWICSEIDYKNKKTIKQVGKKVFNGSENWNVTNSRANGLKEFSVPLENAADTNSDKIVLCNRGKNVGAWLYAEHSTCYIEDGFFRYCKSGNDTNSSKTFKAWVATHNIEIIYSLDEPTEYDLTDEQVEQFKKLKSYYGTTYIDNDAVPACNMTAELVVDTKMYIDNKFTTLAGQILEMGA